jgi:hypothetical protein
MATKTITLEIDAYEKLKRHKRERESFSAVVRRARWDDSATAGQVLAALQNLHRLHRKSFLDDEALDRIEARAGSRARRIRATPTPS